MNHWQTKNLYDRFNGKNKGSSSEPSDSLSDPVPSNLNADMPERRARKTPKKTRKQELAELIDWPDAEELKKILRSDFPAAVAKKLGVSVTNLRAYCSKLKIKIPENSYFFKLTSRLPRDSPKLLGIRHPREKLDKPIIGQPVLTSRYEDILELIEYCKTGDVYAVEDWIAFGHPIQLDSEENFRWGNRKSPLRLAIEKGSRSMCELLLVKGYNPNKYGEFYVHELLHPRRYDLVHLLLDYGYDWENFWVPDVLQTYDEKLINRFLASGMDPVTNDYLAEALTEGVIAPIARFVKEWKKDRPEAINRQLTIALIKGIQESKIHLVRSMLSMGADPYLEVEDTKSFYGSDRTAIDAASWNTDFAYWKALKVDYARIDISKQIRNAIHSRNIKLHEELLKHATPCDITQEEASEIIRSGVTSLSWIEESHGYSWISENQSDERSLLSQLHAFIIRGHKWTPKNNADIEELRRSLRKCSKKAAATVVSMFDGLGGMDQEHLKELCRTPAMRKKLEDATRHEDILHPPKPIKRKRGRPRKERTS